MAFLCTQVGADGESPDGGGVSGEVAADPGDKLYNPNYHTPSSILKGDHGYVAASGGSLDYLDSPEQEGEDGGSKNMRNRKEKLCQTPSISFKTDVQVHYYDQKEGILEKNDESMSPTPQ